jgi:hypothetical protein
VVRCHLVRAVVVTFAFAHPPRPTREYDQVRHALRNSVSPDKMPGNRSERPHTLSVRSPTEREERNDEHLILLGQQQNFAEGKTDRGENQDSVGSLRPPRPGVRQSIHLHRRNSPSSHVDGQPRTRSRNTFPLYPQTSAGPRVDKSDNVRQKAAS